MRPLIERSIVTNVDATIHVLRVPTREGIRHRGMRYGSPGFSTLRDRLAPGTAVVVRVDPSDPAHAFVLDEEGRRWVEVFLLADLTCAVDGHGPGGGPARGPYRARGAIAGVRSSGAGTMPPSIDAMLRRGSSRLARFARDGLMTEGRGRAKPADVG